MSYLNIKRNVSIIVDSISIVKVGTTTALLYMSSNEILKVVIMLKALVLLVVIGGVALVCMDAGTSNINNYNNRLTETLASV